MDKGRIRDEALERRKSLTTRYRHKASKSIIKLLKSMSEWINADVAYLYHNYGSEVETVKLLEESIQGNKRIFLPKVESDTEMRFLEFDSFYDLRKGAYGIYEPKLNNEGGSQSPDLIVVPCVAVDRRGNRIGHGKGYYDRFLAGIGDVPKICLAYDCQLVDDFEADESDVKMDYVITENEIIHT